MIRLDYTQAKSFLPDPELAQGLERARDAHARLMDGSGAGSEYLGWRDLMVEPDDALLGNLQDVAAEIRQRADVFLSIGIGGSYLGAKAVIEALTPYFPTGDGPEVLFAGKDMSGAYLRELLGYLEGKSVYVNVISKSGTTLEPAIAFRFVREWMELHFDDADDRIIVTTDPERGALNELRKAHPYRKYVIPPRVGGRFSVLTPVGLLPIAVAGVDIRSLFYGAVAESERLSQLDNNSAIEYAAVRCRLLENGYSTEVLAHFEPRLSSIGGWWQQLYGESEGKGHNGLLPVSLQYSTDLHSLGQYVQDGKRNLIETFLIAEDDGGDMTVDIDSANLDGLNYLEGKSLTEINRKAYEGTARAHVQGGVPVLTLWLENITPGSIGELIYFFQHAVAVSGYMLRINPFDQPGVEAYKKEMFRLLGKP
ncbi:MAG: glucose-6-phosphate isomerase [Rhodothermales bacterium]|nr:glucose-6-phosphate isomerase [Rhodothermales bacterium]MBO6778828.1 glucose-6-phosphate isomerase [Rhodothermales bacterium]